VVIEAEESKGEAGAIAGQTPGHAQEADLGKDAGFDAPASPPERGKI
jgi:hypothetical protein